MKLSPPFYIGRRNTVALDVGGATVSIDFADLDVSGYGYDVWIDLPYVSGRDTGPDILSHQTLTRGNRPQVISRPTSHIPPRLLSALLRCRGHLIHLSGPANHTPGSTGFTTPDADGKVCLTVLAWGAPRSQGYNCA